MDPYEIKILQHYGKHTISTRNLNIKLEHLISLALVSHIFAQRMHSRHIYWEAGKDSERETGAWKFEGTHFSTWQQYGHSGDLIGQEEGSANAGDAS